MDEKLAREILEERLTEAAIVSASKPVGEFVFAGVYFLITDNRITYVGQSKNILARIGAHRSDGKQFDRFHYILCDPCAFDVVESFYIHLFAPQLNGKMFRRNLHAPLSLADLADLDLDPRTSCG